jgi:hypothetical protein
MNYQLTIWLIVAVTVFIIMPIWVAFGIWKHGLSWQRNDKDGQRRGSAGIGNALMELDRLVARPSVEFTVEAERPVLKREDDQGGK